MSSPAPTSPPPSGAFASVLAEQLRVERIVAGLRVGESAVVNGTVCTRVSLVEAVLLDRYREASLRCRALAQAADFDGYLIVQDELAMCRCQLAAAGRLDLIGESR
jgi:hypothetical protein